MAKKKTAQKKESSGKKQENPETKDPFKEIVEILEEYEKGTPPRDTKIDYGGE